VDAEKSKNYGATPPLTAQGGIVEGKGQVIRADGTVVEFTLKSDPLTQEQADEINQSNLEIEEK
jgi:hypothetical protein